MAVLCIERLMMSFSPRWRQVKDLAMMFKKYVEKKRRYLQSRNYIGRHL